MSHSTPAALGLAADDLWEVLAARHGVVALTGQQPPIYAETVVLFQSAEEVVLFLPQPAAPAGSEVILVDSDADDEAGQDATSVHGAFARVPAADVVGVRLADVPVGSLVPFAADGRLPSLGQVALSVPLATLPESVAEAVSDLVFRDQDDVVDEDDGFAGPLFPQDLPAASGGNGLLFGEAPAPAPPLAAPIGRGRGLPPNGDVTVGRGRGLPSPGGAPPLAGGGRGRGGPRRAASPKPTIASLAAQIAAGFASTQAWQQSMDARVSAVEGRQAGLQPQEPGAAPMGALPPPGLGFPQPALQQGDPAGAAGANGVMRNIAGAIGSLLPRGLSPPRTAGPPQPSRAAPGLPAPVPQALAGGIAPGPVGGAVTPIPGTAPAGAAGIASARPAAQHQQSQQHQHQQPPPAAELPGSQPVHAGVDPAMRAVMEGLAAQSKVLTALARGASGDPSDMGFSDPLQPAPLAMSAGRAADTLMRWRGALTSAPDSVLQRVRANRNMVMQGAAAVPGAAPTYRNYLANEVPFGNARTGAYLMFALADVLDLLEAGRAREAEALGAMALTAGEQSALQGWTWNVAWTMAFVPEPPWQRIRMAPTPEHARVGARLADPGLVTAAVTRFQQMTALAEAQRKAGGLQPPQAPPRQTGAAEGGEQTGGGGGDGQRRKARKGRGGGRGAGASAAGAAAADGGDGP